jgi:hypothetical protein
VLQNLNSKKINVQCKDECSIEGFKAQKGSKYEGKNKKETYGSQGSNILADNVVNQPVLPI